MYLKSLFIRNSGSIKKLYIDTKFGANGNPLPLIVVGPNGSGKTFLSSFISDAFFSMARCYYTNAVETENAYYRIISSNDITTGSEYSLVILNFDNSLSDDEKKKYYTYVEKAHDENHKSDVALLDNEVTSYLSSLHYEKDIRGFLKQVDEEGNKTVFGTTQSDTFADETIKEVFENNVLCFFPSTRSETPVWLNEQAIKLSSLMPDDGEKENEEIYRHLYHEIFAESTQTKNERWLYKILSDASATKRSLKGCPDEYTEAANSSKVIKNLIERILKLIFRCGRVTITRNLRSEKSNLKITCYKKYHDKIGVELSGLNQFSLGESLLFNIFMTILRYADENDPVHSSDFSEIKGIVVIDEIDMHLDTDMQYDALPELMKLFPKIQFIITTHSPLFLLGLENQKNISDFNYQLIEMPDGNEITPERFSEFKKAYDLMKKTAKYESDLRKAVNNAVNRLEDNAILIVTEGKTDHLHLERALNKFRTRDNRYGDLNLVFLNDLIGESKSSGKSNLIIIKDFLSKDPIKTRKYFFMYDRDPGEKDIVFNQDGITTEGNICSFKIPIPEFRKNDILSGSYDESQITIEHYYTDAEIKTSVNIEGLDRRLFIANEFDNNQIHITDDYYVDKSTLCGKHNIHIIDGGGKGKVYKYSSKGQNNSPNYALSKNLFYEKVVADDSKNIGYENFAAIFDLISKELKKMK